MAIYWRRRKATSAARCEMKPLQRKDVLMMRTRTTESATRKTRRPIPVWVRLMPALLLGSGLPAAPAAAQTPERNAILESFQTTEKDYIDADTRAKKVAQRLTSLPDGAERKQAEKEVQEATEAVKKAFAAFVEAKTAAYRAGITATRPTLPVTAPEPKPSETKLRPPQPPEGDSASNMLWLVTGGAALFGSGAGLGVLLTRRGQRPASLAAPESSPAATPNLEPVPIRNRKRWEQLTGDVLQLSMAADGSVAIERVPVKLNQIVIEAQNDEPELARRVERYRQRFLQRRPKKSPDLWTQTERRSLVELVALLHRELQECLLTPAVGMGEPSLDPSETAENAPTHRELLNLQAKADYLQQELEAAQRKLQAAAQEKTGEAEHSLEEIENLKLRHADEISSKNDAILNYETQLDAWKAKAHEKEREAAEYAEQWAGAEAEKNSLLKAAALRPHLAERLPEFPASLQKVVETLLEIMKQVERGDRAALLSAQGIENLDLYVYRPLPPLSLLAQERPGRVEIEDTLRVHTLQAEIHQGLEKAGIQILNPAAGEPFDASLHTYTEQDLVWINDAPHLHNTVAGVRRIGYRFGTEVLRKAEIRRYVVPGERTDSGSALLSVNAPPEPAPASVPMTVPQEAVVNAALPIQTGEPVSDEPEQADAKETAEPAAKSDGETPERPPPPDTYDDLLARADGP